MSEFNLNDELEMLLNGEGYIPLRPPASKEPKYPEAYEWQCYECTHYPNSRFGSAKAYSVLTVVKTAVSLGFMIAEPLNYCTDQNTITTYAFTLEAKKIVSDLQYGDYVEEPLPYGFTISVRSTDGLKPILGWTPDSKLYTSEEFTWDKDVTYSYVLTHLYDPSFIEDFYAVYEAKERAIHIQWKLDNNC